MNIRHPNHRSSGGCNSHAASRRRPGPESQEIAPRVGGEARHADPVQTAQPPHLAAFGDSRSAQATGGLVAAGCQDARLEADWISMAPSAKTETVFYADDRVF